VHQPSAEQFFVEFVLGTIAGTAVFFHAERERIRHPSAWASAVLLALPIALPLYALKVWRMKRTRRNL
jgi:hypothetical protein